MVKTRTLSIVLIFCLLVSLIIPITTVYAESKNEVTLNFKGGTIHDGYVEYVIDFSKTDELTEGLKSFADYRNKFDNTDKNLVIYGHNMRDDSMFGSLKWVINEDWYNNEDNKYITLITENETQVYEVFSVYQIEKEDYYIQTEFSDDNNFEQFVNTIKKRSIKEFNTDVSKDDNILTLSTCANNNKYRVVLHAKKI